MYSCSLLPQPGPSGKSAEQYTKTGLRAQHDSAADCRARPASPGRLPGGSLPDRLPRLACGQPHRVGCVPTLLDPAVHASGRGGRYPRSRVGSLGSDGWLPGAEITSQHRMLQSPEEKTAMAFTATKDLLLPATVTGSWPRPRWYTANMWGRPLDTAMMDPWYREQFADAHAIIVSEQARTGLDILDDGRLPPGRGRGRPVVAPLSAAALEGVGARGVADGEDTFAALVVSGRHDAGFDLQVVAMAARGGQGRARSEEPAGVCQDLADRAAGGGGGRQAGEVRHLFRAGAGVLPGQPHAALRSGRQEAVDLGHGGGDESRIAAAGRFRLSRDPGRGTDAALHGPLQSAAEGVHRFPGRRVQSGGGGTGRRGDLDPHLLGQSEHAEGVQ